MKVAGFSFIKNAIRYEYPVEEAIRSILPLCDKVFVAVGDSDDGTRDLVAGIDPEKMVIIDTVWDAALQQGGSVLAAETDKAFKAIPAEYDWCFYIQGDEVLHEQYLPLVKEAMHNCVNEPGIDGLLFNYTHFYGSYDYVGNSGKWYQHEIRVIKNNKQIYSYRDAQGFRKNNNEKLHVKPIAASIYHYGWVRPPVAMQQKTSNFVSYWGVNEEKGKNAEAGFDYSQIDSLSAFTGTHPQVMHPRIARMNWKFNWDISYNRTKWKDRFKNWCTKWLGYTPFTYRNYRIK